MDVEIPMLEVMDDSEKNNGTLPDAEGTPTAIVTKASVVRNRHKTRLRKALIISAAVLGVLVFLVGFISLSFFFLSKVIKAPDIYVIGNITGNVSANLGTLGHVHLTPELQLSIKVNV